MNYFEPSGHSMYLALQDFYPRVTPSMEFVSNLFTEFEKENDLSKPGFIQLDWAVQLANWLPNNTGLIRDPVDVNWDKFRIVDEKLYTLALLKYS